MEQPILTHEARCLVILAGSVLERCVETRAVRLAKSRSSVETSAHEVENAIRQSLSEDLRILLRTVPVVIFKRGAW